MSIPTRKHLFFLALCALFLVVYSLYAKLICTMSCAALTTTPLCLLYDLVLLLLSYVNVMFVDLPTAGQCIFGCAISSSCSIRVSSVQTSVSTAVVLCASNLPYY
jgi:hypothetical protein